MQVDFSIGMLKLTARLKLDEVDPLSVAPCDRHLDKPKFYFDISSNGKLRIYVFLESRITLLDAGTSTLNDVPGSRIRQDSYESRSDMEVEKAFKM